LVAFFLATPLFAQYTANQWIDYSQSYYKFKVYEDGLYRIDYQSLIDSDIPINTFNPQNLQLFARGEEIPIYVKGEQDGVFNSTDYIEFYARRNDGWLDTIFYKGSQNQPNPYYSLITDTIHYYLTWNTSNNNLRFQESNAIDFSNYFSASYIWKEVVQQYNSSYYDGEILAGGTTDPEYVPSEGWMNAAMNLGGSMNINVATPNRYSSGPFFDLEMKIAGESNWNLVNNGDHHLQIRFGNQLIDRVFEAYDLLSIKESFSSSEIVAGNNLFRFESINDRGSNVDRTALAYIKLTYPHTMSLSNNSYYEFLVDDANNQSAQYLEFLFFRGDNEPVLYDLDNLKKVKVVQTLSSYRALVPNGGGRKHCVIAATSAITPITKLQAVGNNGLFINYLDQLTDTSYLVVTHDRLIQEATTYAAYRNSQGRNVLVVDIEQLYDQYAYGINKNPLAIRHFIDVAQSPSRPPLTHLFLIGKSVAAKQHRKASNGLNLGYERNLVPTMGNPATDHLLTSGLKNTNIEPLLPTGRLSAQNNSQISWYLDKVIEYETATPDKWMKRALHFAGGNNTFEANRHENYLNAYSQDYQGSPMGGQTQLFRKSTSSPFQVTLSDSIRSLINEGVSLLTFFGHASANGGFDISIDSPDKLQNKGKYHVLLANSCFTGNTHQNGLESTSEQYVLERDRGAIAFIASGNLGLPSFLNTYTSALYENFAGKNYGKSLAENMIEAIKDIQSANISGPLKGVCMEMTLQGDPALVMNAHTLEDYSVEEDNVQISPAEITTDLDSFSIAIRVDNLGRVGTDSVIIQLSRKYPVGGVNDSIALRKVGPIRYDQEMVFTFPVDVINGVGNNEFSLLIDPLDEIAELSKLNNRYDFNVLIRSGEIIPVYPYRYGIVGSQRPSLSASTAFAFEQEKQYLFELDTVSSFNSPFKSNKYISSGGGLIQWEPAALQSMQDSMVYFWRVSKVPAIGEQYSWRQSSFQYIPNEKGWAQDHFNQFDNNDYLFIEQLPPDFVFTDNVKELSVQTFGEPNFEQRNSVYYAVDADLRERGSCYPSPAFLIAILDSLSFDSWETPFNGQNLQNDFGQANVGAWCAPSRNRSEQVFNFQSRDTAQMFAMRDFILNSIPDGHYVVAYNWFSNDYDAINNIDTSILRSFETLGATVFQGISTGQPFIITAKKGDPSSIQEVRGNSITDKIELRRVLRTSADFGEITSGIIGPSTQVSRLSYRITKQESGPGDSAVVNLIGIDDSGDEQTLFASSRLELDTITAPFLNANTYKRLKLELRAYDEINRTAPQLDRWQVSYVPLPELALAPNLHFSINKDSLQQGEQLEVEVAIQNLSEVDMDSVLVDIHLLDNKNRMTSIPYARLAPLEAGRQAVMRLDLPTISLLGRYTLLINVNPNQDQPEQYAFNNIGQLDFYVYGDQLNPLLDVTFDGRHILNREIVSSTPQIQVSLKDENNFLVLDDTSAFEMYLRYPNGTEELLNYKMNASYELQFVPASLPENRARVIFRPQLTEDGVYRLRVSAKDKSGNASGNQDYQVDFEVVNKSTVSRLLNYPNPFSTSTRFVFTLTGSRIPDQLLIQIMTVTGKVVREIDQMELGPIHIGNNISEFAWDGKDMYGDQLANGLYLYRVKMRIDGQSIEHRSTEADKFFKKGFGKMYLLR
jgi:hypothetical protein